MASRNLEVSLSALEAVVEEVRRVHPLRQELPERPEGLNDAATALLERIAGTPVKGLPALALALKMREQVVCVHALVLAEGGELRNKVALVLNVKPRTCQIRPCWSVFRSHCRERLVAEVVHHISSTVLEKGSGRLDDGPTKRVATWMAAGEPLNAIVQEIDDSQFTLPQWAKAMRDEGIRLEDDQLLVDELKKEILLIGSESLILRHAAGVIRQWVLSLLSDEYERFAIHYLRTLQSENWDVDILEEIVRRYGLPAAGQPFWRKIPQAIRDKVQRLVMGKRLEETLGRWDTGQERYKIWNQFLGDFSDFQLSSSQEYIYMEFRAHFIVVEFRDIGNAAYFYDMGQERWIRRRFGGPKEWLKVQGLCFFRFIHRGDWPERLFRIMRYLLKRGRRIREDDRDDLRGELWSIQ